MGLIILRTYKLNDHDVEWMAKCNAGEISCAEAEAQMTNKYERVSSDSTAARSIILRAAAFCRLV